MTPEQETRIRALIAKLTTSEEGGALLLSALDEAGLALLRKARLDTFPTCTDPDRLAAAWTGIILDSETTGLERTDEVVELAMLRFRFDEAGVLSLDAVFTQMREPNVPISEEASQVTGITAEMLAGKRIDEADVAAFLQGAELIIAHNAAFDRPMVERTFPASGFDRFPWHCSLEQVDWQGRGKKGRSLESVVLSEGYVYGSHRADADVIATAFALNATGVETAFAEMLRNGERETIQVIAKDSRIDAKDALKGAGFKWSPDGAHALGHRAWHKEIPDTAEEKAALSELIRSRAVYGKEMSLPAVRMSPLNRYSGRKPEAPDFFRTAEFQTIQAEMDARVPDQPSLF
jgi:DNA polymerase-3 subunit epsilon